MTISSRTPEGLPNHRPVCDSDVCIEPSVLIGDATCPNCGSLLWFLNVETTTRVYDRSASRGIRDRVITFVAKQLSVAPDKIAGMYHWSTISVLIHLTPLNSSWNWRRNSTDPRCRSAKP